ncbi:Sec2p domain-containing protein [Mycena indigotica]|uniref:Sec2p domain-containing protein n=1 Tax=Mycena indigotica TaxID=2126181 RepID=A0A8H6TG43_9AGAR|nr:Sec2p domain-containing protein [Mycena indigotica]KAF7316092.1 Sec2p domain-containing protein [Mycena indigotica]
MSETPRSPAPSIKSVHTKAGSHQLHGSDADAQEMLIATLRSQIQDLFSQVTQLNSKLVKSYDRVSDLEDDLHVAAAQGRQSTLKISQLELERTQHLSALNTGLLVEKSQVTAELTRLMEKATEEAAQRGQAETAKADIEKDLDDLSATLFAQANTMVAEARYAQSQADRRVEQAETALKGAEEMVGMMQQQMQTLQTEKDDAEKKAQDMRVIMGKGKWVDRRSGSSGSLAKETRLLSSHLPYEEFLLFVAHLRSVHPSSPTPPAMTTLLTMPFLARLSSEDSEPTVRLDLAPSLNWLSRRSVLAAIHTGQLTIEPMSSSALLAESSTSSNIPGLNSSNNNISCALCGTPIFSLPEPSMPSRPPTHPSLSGANTWSASVIKKTLSGSPTPPARSMSRPNSQSVQPSPAQIHVFRIAAPLPPAQPTIPPTRTASPSPFLPNVGGSRNATPNSPPQASTGLGNPLSALAQSQSSPVYPLCTSGWCLGRLRSTCTLWAFVRTDIVNRVWEEEVPTIPQPPTNGTAQAPPPVPPRRRGLWGMASKLGERAASWSADAKEKKSDPVPPPMNSASPKPATTAPPLPRRNEGRTRRGTVSLGSGGPPTLPPRDVPPAVVEEPKGEEPKATATIIEEETTPVTVESETKAEAPAISALKTEAVQKRLSAHQVPLPDSRPGTPIDTTAVGAPPPIPRRAAGRRPVPPPPGTVNGDVTPRAESPAPAPTATSPPASPPSPVMLTAPSTPKEEAPAPVLTLGETPEQAKVDDVVPQTENTAVEGSLQENNKPSAEIPRVDSPTNVPEVPPKAEGNGHVQEEPKAEEEQHAVDGDGEVYIGDVTWEERTWKELIRLREDMFWARVGGIRG